MRHFTIMSIQNLAVYDDDNDDYDNDIFDMFHMIREALDGAVSSSLYSRDQPLSFLWLEWGFTGRVFTGCYES